jgi:DNA polymerase III alpha subunit
MSRPNSKLWLVVPALMLAIVVSACGGGEETTLLNKYFMASKVSDNMTLSNIATVAFDPKTDGQMQSFGIDKVSEPVVTPLQIKQHAAELKAASDEEKVFSDKKKVFQEANGDAIDRILKAEQKNQTLKGKDAELQKEWTKWREETAVYAKKVSEARKKVAAEQPIVEISCQDQRNPIDTTAFEGESTTKDVTISGKVKTDAGTVAKKYVFTLQRIVLKGVNGKDVVGRWVITNRKDAE